MEILKKAKMSLFSDLRDMNSKNLTISKPKDWNFRIFASK